MYEVHKPYYPCTTHCLKGTSPNLSSSPAWPLPRYLHLVFSSTIHPTIMGNETILRLRTETRISLHRPHLAVGRGSSVSWRLPGRCSGCRRLNCTRMIGLQPSFRPACWPVSLSVSVKDSYLACFSTRAPFSLASASSSLPVRSIDSKRCPCDGRLPGRSKGSTTHLSRH